MHRFYGRKIKFRPNSPIIFEEFSLTYIGDRRVSSDIFPRGFLYRDFKVKNESEEQVASWSGGAGDIAPAVFGLGGKFYVLELALSDRFGRLAADELIVWEK